MVTYNYPRLPCMRQKLDAKMQQRKDNDEYAVSSILRRDDWRSRCGVPRLLLDMLGFWWTLAG
jgi:hypothetical protein